MNELQHNWQSEHRKRSRWWVPREGVVAPLQQAEAMAEGNSNFHQIKDAKSC